LTSVITLIGKLINITGLDSQGSETEFYLGTKKVNDLDKICLVIEDYLPEAHEGINRSEFDTNQYPRTLDLRGNSISLIEKPAYLRHSNATEVRCEIRYGKDDSVFELVEVLVDYIKSP